MLRIPIHLNPGGFSYLEGEAPTSVAEAAAASVEPCCEFQFI